jgi:hypothetical protein
MLRPTSIQKLFHLFVAVSLLAVTFLFTSPVSAQDLAPNPVAEQYLLDDLRATGSIDLEWYFTTPEERVIGGQFLADALKDAQVVSNHSIYIANATVVGDVWLDNRTFTSNLDFRKMEFDGMVNLAGGQLQSLTIYDSTFNDSLSFLRSSFSGNVDVRYNEIKGGLTLYGAHISGELLLDSTRILGTAPMEGSSYPTEVWLTTVDGLASFTGTEFQGEAKFSQASFGRMELTGAIFNSDAYLDGLIVEHSITAAGVSFSGSADFTDLTVGDSADFKNSIFKAPVSYENSSVERNADFSYSKFRSTANFSNFSAGNFLLFKSVTFNLDVTFENATTSRQADFTDAVFNGKAVFDYFTADRFMDFVNTDFKKDFSLYYATVAWPYFDQATFRGPVTFEGIHTSEDLEFTDTSYEYKEKPFPVTLANVEGAVVFTNFSAPAGLLLSDSHFGSLSLLTKDNPTIQLIDLTDTDIDGDLSLDNVNMKDFLAGGVSVGGSTTLYRVTIAEQLDLRNANIGFLKLDDQFTPPTSTQSFNLRGMTYSDIDMGDQGLTDLTRRALLKYINDSAYSPQAYQALSQFLTDKGHPEWAADVDLAQKRRERNEVLTPLSGGWFWSWFLDIFSGYGHRPAQAFIWSALVVAVGSFVFRRREDMCPVEQEDVRLEYNPIWYSFALFLPYIDLGIASKWEPTPEKKWMRTYKYVHMMMGWILAPIALLTFGGIIG